MPVPVRSIRLQKRSSQSLDTLSGASGEIFFDADRGTLRLYTANQADNITIADRAWVTANTFSGNYTDLTNIPTVVYDYMYRYYSEIILKYSLVQGIYSRYSTCKVSMQLVQ